MEEGKPSGSRLSMSYWASLAGSAATKLRSVSPDLATAKSACASSYGYACRASEAVKGVVNDPIEVSVNKINSWAPDPESREAILKALAGAGVSAAGEALKCFVPGGHPLYRITKAGASGFSDAYSRKGAEEPEKEEGAGSEGLGGSSALDAFEKKLQAITGEMNELKMQNQMLREKVSGLSVANQPSDSPPLLLPEAVPSWQKSEDVIRMFTAEGLKGKDLRNALLIPKFTVSYDGETEIKS